MSCSLVMLVVVCVVKFGWLHAQRERSYSEIKTDYSGQRNIDEKYGYVMSLNKTDFATFFINPSFITDILVPVFNCASSNSEDADRCQALLVAIIRKTHEQALNYYNQYAQAVLLIDRPYQLIRVLQDMYAYSPKKIARALEGIVTADPAVVMIQFKGDVIDFGLIQYALLKYVSAVLKNAGDQTWMPFLVAVIKGWQTRADAVTRAKITDFSAADIIALAKLDEFENAREKAVNPSPLLTTDGLANILGLQQLFAAL